MVPGADETEESKHSISLCGKGRSHSLWSTSRFHGVSLGTCSQSGIDDIFHLLLLGNELHRTALLQKLKKVNFNHDLIHWQFNVDNDFEVFWNGILKIFAALFS